MGERRGTKYPVGSRHHGRVVNVMSYGAFVKLEAGHRGPGAHQRDVLDQAHQPSQRAGAHRRRDRGAGPQHQQGQAGDLAGHEADPAEPVGQGRRAATRRARIVNGTVRNLTNYGAFIEIEEGIDGLLHVSDMRWIRKVGHPSEVVKKGEKVKCRSSHVDQERQRIALGLKQMDERPVGRPTSRAATSPASSSRARSRRSPTSASSSSWSTASKGLLHISELADHKVENPEDVVKVGDEIEVKILRVDADDRKIGLSRKRVEWSEEDEKAERRSHATAPVRAGPAELKGGVGSTSGPLFKSASSPKQEAGAAESAEADQAGGGA